ncbi:unnamed protein product [Protopolystoma xenopodis]|uniref:Uncharacterized protein n=1 Tax=Protopolystoma xenopodis TaxID=117903 RepID=A0A448X9R7_9PLAT|nr:unnamed protein product [Protopolystoma xenopodis]
MRDAVLAALNSPRRSAKLLGFVSSSFDITDSTASDSVRAGVTSSVPLKTRALHCLISLLIRLVTDANFNVVLCSLDIGTKIITFLAKHARNIHLLEPSKIAMFNWISLRMLRMVRIALTDSKLVVRVAGSKLAMAVARLPGGGMILAKQLAGRALLDAYRYQQIISRTNASVSTF